jgi:hypothetical protein
MSWGNIDFEMERTFAHEAVDRAARKHFAPIFDALKDFEKRFRCNVGKPTDVYISPYTLHSFAHMLSHVVGVEEVRDTFYKEEKAIYFTLEYTNPFLIQECLYDLNTVLRNNLAIGINFEIVEEIKDRIFYLKFI